MLISVISPSFLALRISQLLLIAFLLGVLSISDSPAQSRAPVQNRELERAQALLLIRSCQFQSARALGAPTLTVREVKPAAGVFQGMFKIRGYVEGVCLQEAGVWESGRRTQTIRVSVQRRFQRFPFEARAKVGEEIELRATNTAGETVRLAVPLPKAATPAKTSFMGDGNSDSPFERRADSWETK